MQNPRPSNGFIGQKPAKGVYSSPSNPFDIAGQFNVLINAYLTYFGKLIEAYGTQIIIGLLLIAVMILSAYMFLKE